MATWTIARLIAAIGGTWPRPGGVAVVRVPIAFTALRFHSRTMSVGSAAETDAAGISIAAPSTTMAIGAESRRATLDRWVRCTMDAPSGVAAQAEQPARPLYRVLTSAVSQTTQSSWAISRNRASEAHTTA